MEKSKKITILATIILVGFTFGVIYHYILGFYLKAPNPFNSFLYNPNWAFCDLFGVMDPVRDFAPYNKVELWAAYFPLLYLILYPLTFINKIIVLVPYTLIFMWYMIKMNIKMFQCEDLGKLQNFQNIFIMTMLSYPVLYAVDKSNTDMYLLMLFAAAAFCFKEKKYMASALFLAFLNAMKPFTILFLLLFLRERKYKELIVNIALTAILVISGFLILKGPFFEQIQVFLKIQELFKHVYGTSPGLGVGFCSNIFFPLKALFLMFTHSPEAMVKFVKVYDYMCAAAVLFTCVFVWREKSYWKQMALIVCNFLLLPYCTYDYKLLFLFVPLWMFVNTSSKTRFDLTYTILFGLLFIPKSIIILIGTKEWTSFSTMLNPFIILAIALLIVYEQLFVIKKDEESEKIEEKI